MSEVILSHRVDLVLGKSKDATHPKDNVYKRIDVAIENSGDFITPAEAESVTEYGELLNHWYQWRGQPVEIEYTNAGQ